MPGPHSHVGGHKKPRHIEERHVQGKRLGRHVHHDPRSLAYQVRASGALQTVLWQRKIGTLDQGNLGSCTGNAATGAIGTLPLWDELAGTQKEKLNEAEAIYLYGAATALDPYPGQYPPDDTGSDGLSVAKAAQKAGLISGYLHATSIAAMNTALQSGPVIVGVNWYEGFDNPDATGLVKISGSVRGGHEFEVLGYDVPSDTYTAVNSWGASWGVAVPAATVAGGGFRFTGATMARLLDEDGDCTQLLPLSVPPPQPDLDAALWASVKDWAAARHVLTNAAAARAVTAWAKAKGLT